MAYKTEGFNFGQFKSGGLHEMHAIATLILGNISAFVGFEVFTAVVLKSSSELLC
jgi:hypothetical protein